MYFFNFLDRSAMVNGKLDGLADDLDLKGTQYNTCISILFVGYLVGQVPSNMVLSRVRPSFYLAGKRIHYRCKGHTTSHLTKSLKIMDALQDSTQCGR